MTNKHFVKFYPVLVMVLAGLMLGGCSQPTGGAEVQMEEWSITIEVAGGKTIEFTNEDALEIGPVEVTIAEKDKDTTKEEEQWTGVLL
jgi:hypothetical protein